MTPKDNAPFGVVGGPIPSKQAAANGPDVHSQVERERVRPNLNINVQDASRHGPFSIDHQTVVSINGSSIDDLCVESNTSATSHDHLSNIASNSSNNDDKQLLSPSSAVSTHYFDRHPEFAGLEPEAWHQRRTENSFVNIHGTRNHELKEAFPGAMRVLSQLNPDEFEVPYGVGLLNPDALLQSQR